MPCPLGNVGRLGCFYHLQVAVLILALIRLIALRLCICSSTVTDTRVVLVNKLLTNVGRSPH